MGNKKSLELRISLVLTSRQCWKWARNMIFEEWNKILRPKTLGQRFLIFNVWVYNFRSRWDDDVIFSITSSFDVRNDRAKFQGHSVCGSWDLWGGSLFPLSFWDVCKIQSFHEGLMQDISSFNIYLAQTRTFTTIIVITFTKFPSNSNTQ